GPGSGTMSLLAELKSSSGEVLGSLSATAPATSGYGPGQVFTFTATTTNSTLSFKDASSATIAVDLLLDNVSVTRLSECVPAPAGLVSWWRGEGNATDSLRTNDGNPVGGVTFAPGRIGQAFSFDGTGEVFVNDAPPLNVQALTADAWIFPTSLDGEVEII